MQLAIVQNPHTENPQDLMDALSDDGFQDIPESDMGKLKGLFGGSPSLKVAGQENVE